MYSTYKSDSYPDKKEPVSTPRQDTFRTFGILIPESQTRFSWNTNSFIDTMRRQGRKTLSAKTEIKVINLKRTFITHPHNKTNN